MQISRMGDFMNELKIVNIPKYNKEIKKLYKEAFPRNERIPINILQLLTSKNKAKFYGIYDGEEFIALLYNVYYKDIVLILYLAINNNFRGKGYGSKVLDLIKQKYSQNRIILNIEQIDENSSNNKQRIKRKEFYQKNGFTSLNYTVKEGKETYEMLCYSKNKSKVSKEEYESLVKYFLKNILYKIYKKSVNKR